MTEKRGKKREEKREREREREEREREKTTTTTTGEQVRRARERDREREEEEEEAKRMSPPLLRKRVQAPPSRKGGGLGAKRLGDITNTIQNDDDDSKYQTKAGNFFASTKGNSGKPPARSRSSSLKGETTWDAWESWTETASETLDGVTRLVMEETPNFSNARKSEPARDLDTYGSGSNTIRHNGNIISTSSGGGGGRGSANASISRDISTLKNQSFKAFSSLSKAANSWAQALEETIDGGIKEVSRTFSVVQPERNTTAMMALQRQQQQRISSATTSTSSHHAVYTGISGAPYDEQNSQQHHKTESKLLKQKKKVAAPISSSRKITSGSPQGGKPGSSREDGDTSGAVGIGKGGANTVEYLGKIWTKEIGDILSGFNTSATSFGLNSSSAQSHSPENRVVLERLHKKAIEKQEQLESTKQQVIASQLEAKKLQNRNSKLEKHIHKFKDECENLKKQNNSLKEQVDNVVSSQDVASMQLEKQLQILLQEKAKLQMENQKLQSENNGLQELLSYAIPSHSPSEMEEGADVCTIEF